MDGDILISSGILAFLADRFNVRSREEFATDGLGYLLQGTRSSDIVVNELSNPPLPRRPGPITFISQARSADDSWVVDLEGGIDERVYISVEGKLDARLQPSQPVEYMKRLQMEVLRTCVPVRGYSRLQKELEQRAGNDDLLEPNASWGRAGAAGISWIPLTKRRQLRHCVMERSS